MDKKDISVVPVPIFTSENTEYDVKYKRSVKWDREKGDFVLDGAARMVESDGAESFAQWCYKTALTERYRCLAYPNTIGAEMERATSDSDEATVESMVQRTVTEAIMVNPRAEWVRDFLFTWDGDTMHCVFYVKGLNIEDPFEILI